LTIHEAAEACFMQYIGECHAALSLLETIRTGSKH
jgi:hypothetical protein